jgi:hypothetical protein
MAESKDTTEPTAWEKLRAPFPPEFIEKLPEVKDRATGKVKRPELDYVSAGHVIDRLLQVDPTWTWTWGVEDPVTGKPSKALSLTYEKDGSISLWMAMHVNGVVKVDVGYVSPGQYGMPDEPMKHVVSDAITRCARLFGVALDLWIGTPRPRPWDMGPVVIGADAIATTNAISYRARHDLPPSGIAAGVQGVSCPTEGCMGTLVQRATKTGKNPGSPYLVCSLGKNGCGLSPIWDTTLEAYIEGKEDFANSTTTFRDIPAAPEDVPPPIMDEIFPGSVLGTAGWAKQAQKGTPK